MALSLTEYQKSLLVKQYCQQRIGDSDFRRKSSSNRIDPSSNISIEICDSYNSYDEEDTLQFIIVSLSENNWSRLESIRFRGSANARTFLQAMTKNPHNFPSLSSIDVCKTDVTSHDLDELAKYLCTNPFFVRKYPEYTIRQNTQSVFIAIYSSVEEHSFESFVQSNVLAIYHPETVTTNCKLIFVGGYKPVLE